MKLVHYIANFVALVFVILSFTVLSISCNGTRTNKIHFTKHTKLKMTVVKEEKMINLARTSQKLPRKKQQ